ncbi:hypothetical protein C2S53_002558 [Perilla frutescens var. hirtella]|uniref:Uncharacterized protein n=1 Tax=Perilla frutescens var. hirtella TaxID=608512 RepID=A0AAD4JLM4_PERFH|nr:hypothetical protein C2S53_002558 [Perilla frutescens var. hirtella]
MHHHNILFDKYHPDYFSKVADRDLGCGGKRGEMWLCDWGWDLVVGDVGVDCRDGNWVVMMNGRQFLLLCSSVIVLLSLLMWVVPEANDRSHLRAKNKGIEANEVNYYDQILTSFSKIVSDKLIVDRADGVGGEKLEKIKTRLGYLTIDVHNCGDGVHNEGVGADFLQKEKVVPRSFGIADAGMR